MFSGTTFIYSQLMYLNPIRIRFRDENLKIEHIIPNKNRMNRSLDLAVVVVYQNYLERRASKL